jgi:hypothetical protein
MTDVQNAEVNAKVKQFKVEILYAYRSSKDEQIY